MARKKISLVCMLALLCALLAGCRFAAEEKIVQEDRYVGVSVWIEDMGEPIGTDEEGVAYYAGSTQEMPVELTEEQTRAMIRGEAIDWGRPEYPVGDRSFYVSEWVDDMGNESTGFEQSKWPGTLKNHISVSDTEEKYECDAIVYVTGPAFRHGENTRMVLLNLDDIFVRPDGTRYASRENGSVSGSIDGFSRETTVRSSTTDSKGETSAFVTRIKITIEYVIELQSARVFAFREDGAMLSKTELAWQDAQDALPYAIPEGAAYLVLEETGIDVYGETVTQRTLSNLPLSQDAAAFTLKVPFGDGFAVPLPVVAEK